MEIPEELLNFFKAVDRLSNKGGEITMENDILTKNDWQNLRAKIDNKRRLLEDDIEYRRMVIRNEHNYIDMDDMVCHRNGDELENCIGNDSEYQTLKYQLARLQDQYKYITVLGRIPPDYDQ